MTDDLQRRYRLTNVDFEIYKILTSMLVAQGAMGTELIRLTAGRTADQENLNLMASEMQQAMDKLKDLWEKVSEDFEKYE
jgi:hypothetical protein